MFRLPTLGKGGNINQELMKSRSSQVDKVSTPSTVLGNHAGLVGGHRAANASNTKNAVSRGFQTAYM